MKSLSHNHDETVGKDYELEWKNFRKHDISSTFFRAEPLSPFLNYKWLSRAYTDLRIAVVEHRVDAAVLELRTLRPFQPAVDLETAVGARQVDDRATW